LPYNATMTSHQQSTTEQPFATIIQPSQQSRKPFPTPHNPDPDASFHQQPETWHFSGHRKASTPATDVGEIPSHTSVDDQKMYEEVMRETKDMSAEQVKEYLSKQPYIDGEKIMKGREGEGYLGLTGALSGTM
jgi:hypothetical protein